MCHRRRPHTDLRWAAIGPVFVILKGRSFQNAILFGNLSIDVADDSVDPAKPWLEWMGVRELPFAKYGAVPPRTYGDGEMLEELSWAATVLRQCADMTLDSGTTTMSTGTHFGANLIVGVSGTGSRSGEFNAVNASGLVAAHAPSPDLRLWPWVVVAATP